MDIKNMLISSGYVGSFGETWKTPTEADLETAILGAMEINTMSREEVVATLESGASIAWRKSPNYYYDHSYGKIGTAKQRKPEPLARCDCGHSVPENQRMRASLGTSCPDCYDRMSD